MYIKDPQSAPDNLTSSDFTIHFEFSWLTLILIVLAILAIKFL